MTTTTRPTCKRPRCTNVAHPSKNADGLCRKHARAAGRLLPQQPVAPVAAHIQSLLDAGWTREQIAEHAGTNLNTIINVLAGRYRSVNGVLAKRILAVAGHYQDPAFQPRWRATRRVRALRAAGHTVRELSDGMGLSPAEISQLCNRNDGKITRDTWHKVASYYHEHEGDAVRPATFQILHRRWLTPYMWNNIDDPDEKPDKPNRPLNSSRREITQDDRAAVAKLYAHYGAWNQIRNRVGLPPDSMNRIISAKRGATATRAMLDRVHAAARSIPTPLGWEDYMPARGRSLMRPITQADLDNIDAARKVCGTYNAIDTTIGLPWQFCTSAHRRQRKHILDSWARRLADLAAQAVGEEAA